MNKDLKLILEKAIAACVEGAMDAMTCMHGANPAWARVEDALDECTDILRGVEAELNDG